MIYLVQLCKDSARNGGCATFTEHLWKSFRLMGYEAEVFRVMTSRTEQKQRYWSNDCPYRNVEYYDFLLMVEANPGPVVITVVDHGEDNADSMFDDLNPWFVFHDYRSVKGMVTDLDNKKVVVIRKSNLDKVRGSVFIPHPYVRFYHEVPALTCRELFMLSHTRIDFDKRQHIMLEANKHLPPEKQIVIVGRENRIYGKFKLQQIDPTWEIGTREFGRGWGASQRQAARAVFNLDLTLIRGDGSGSQYSTLEAMDAGAIPVLAEDWGRTDFDAFYVPPTAEGLCEFINKTCFESIMMKLLDMQAANIEYLSRVHSPHRVVSQWVEQFHLHGESVGNPSVTTSSETRTRS